MNKIKDICMFIGIFFFFVFCLISAPVIAANPSGIWQGDFQAVNGFSGNISLESTVKDEIIIGNIEWTIRDEEKVNIHRSRIVGEIFGQNIVIQTIFHLKDGGHITIQLSGMVVNAEPYAEFSFYGNYKLSEEFHLGDGNFMLHKFRAH